MKVSAQLELDKTAYRSGDVLEGSVLLITEDIGKIYCELKWVDVYGRVLKVLKFKESLPNNRYVRFTFELKNALSIKNFIECELFSVSGESLFNTRREFIITPEPKPWDDYVILIWNPGRTKEYLEKIKKLGINAGMAHSPQPDVKNLLDANLRFYLAQLAPMWLAFYHQTGRQRKEWQPMKEAYRKTGDKRFLVRKNCLNDPAVMSLFKARIRRIVSDYKIYGPLWYDISDEAGIGDLVGSFDFCFCPHCLQKMRDWLKSIYGSLEALNEEWGTDFRSWDEVEPMTADEVRRRGDYNLAAWADHRTFMEITFADAFRRCRDWIAEIDPTRPSGLTGGQMPSAYGGYDWWRLTNTLDFIEAYNIGNNREIIRSFGGKRVIHVITLFNLGAEAEWTLWYHLLHGDRGVILWDADEGRGKRYVIEPSLEINPEGLKMKSVFMELRGGIAKLLNLSEFEDDRIAIHYSQSSIHAHWMLETEEDELLLRDGVTERKRSNFMKLRESLLKILEDLGFQYKFVSYEEVENGELIRGGYKVFILPKSIALSPREAEQIKAYVEAGGIVVADGLLGLMDEHCKKLEKGLLDDLFGISRETVDVKPRQRNRGDVKIKAEFPGLKLSVKSLKIPIMENCLKENGSKALAESKEKVKALFVKRVGKGLTIYLNMDLTDYFKHRITPDGGEDFRRLFEAILRLAGLKPKIELINLESGEKEYRCEIFRWRNRESLYVGILKNPSLRISEIGGLEAAEMSEKIFRREDAVKIKLPKKLHVYDIRERKYMGFKDEVETTVPAYRPRILALTPYKVLKMKLWVKEYAKPGDLVPVKARVIRSPESLNDTVIRIEIYDPSGKQVEYYSGNYKASEGLLKVDIPLALNDPEGIWKVKAKDIESGEEAEATFIVRRDN